MKYTTTTPMMRSMLLGAALLLAVTTSSSSSSVLLVHARSPLMSAGTGNNTAPHQLATFVDDQCAKVAGTYPFRTNVTLFHDTKAAFFVAVDADHGVMSLHPQQYNFRQPKYAARQSFGAPISPFWASFYQSGENQGPLDVQFAWMSYKNWTLNLWEAAKGETQSGVVRGKGTPPTRPPEVSLPMAQVKGKPNFFFVNWIGTYENLVAQQCNNGGTSNERFYGWAYSIHPHPHTGCFRPLWPLAVQTHADVPPRCQTFNGHIGGTYFRSVMVSDIRK